MPVCRTLFQKVDIPFCHSPQEAFIKGQFPLPAPAKWGQGGENRGLPPSQNRFMRLSATCHQTSLYHINIHENPILPDIRYLLITGRRF